MTAEFAMVLPAVVALALLLCSLGRAVVVRIECQDAAHAIAQQTVVQMSSEPQGDDGLPAGLQEWADGAAARLVASGAAVSLEKVEGGVEVKVSAPIVPDPLGVLPAMVAGRAFACVP